MDLKPALCLNKLRLAPNKLCNLAVDAWHNRPWTGQSMLHRTGSSEITVREFEPGEFEWSSDVDHSGCVIAGQAVLSLADGREVTLRPGASFYLPQGLYGRWAVQQRLRAVIVSNR